MKKILKNPFDRVLQVKINFKKVDLFQEILSLESFQLLIFPYKKRGSGEEEVIMDGKLEARRE
jgi:hypothetical protein